MNHRLYWMDATGLALCGAGVGWLCGLAASPVLQVIVASLLTAAAAMVAAISGIEPSRAERDETAETKRAMAVPAKWRRLRTFPIAILIVSLALGASAGVYARTRNWLGEDLASEVRRWTRTGYDEQTIYRKLFDRQVVPEDRQTVSERRSAGGESKNASSPPDAALVSRGVLFADVSPDRCKELRNSSDKLLRSRLSLLNDERVTRFAAEVEDPGILRAFVKKLYARSNRINLPALLRPAGGGAKCSFSS